MTKFGEIKNADVIDIAGLSVASNWTEQKYGFVLAHAFAKGAGLPFIFSCIAEIKKFAVADSGERVKEAAEYVCGNLDGVTLDGVNSIAAHWNAYEGRDSQYYVEGYLDGRCVLLLNIETSNMLSYHDFTINAFAEKPYKSLVCSLVGLAISSLDAYATKFTGR